MKVVLAPEGSAELASALVASSRVQIPGMLPVSLDGQTRCVPFEDGDTPPPGASVIDEATWTAMLGAVAGVDPDPAWSRDWPADVKYVAIPATEATDAQAAASLTQQLAYAERLTVPAGTTANGHTYSGDIVVLAYRGTKPAELSVYGTLYRDDLNVLREATV